MSSDKAVEALRRSRANDSQTKQTRARAVIEALKADRRSVTVSSVAREAKVSREFVYSHQTLIEAIEEANSASHSPPPDRVGDGDSRTRQVADGLRADRSTLLAQIKQLRARLEERDEELASLRDQRQRWLGAQIEATGVNPEEHAELRITHERLLNDNVTLRRRLDDAQRLIRTLEADLAASRQAHQEDVVALSSTGGNVVPLNGA